MLPYAASIYGLVVLVAATVIATRIVLGSWVRRHEGDASATSRVATMEERIQKLEEATSGMVAEFAAVRERERFMTQIVESRARKDARAAGEAPPLPAADPAAADTTSPFVVQTVSAVRRNR